MNYDFNFDKEPNELDSNSLGSVSLNPEVNNNETNSVVGEQPVSTEVPEVPQPSVDVPVVDTPVGMDVNSEPVVGGFETPSEGVAQPIPGTEETKIEEEPKESTGFNLGTLPPEEKKEEPKKGKKLLFLIVVLLIMAAVAFGIYYFLVVSKNKNNGKFTVTFKEVNLPLGSELSTNITDFITVKNGDASKCIISGDSVIDTTKEGVYEYSVICGEEIVKGGKVTVADKEAPKVYLNTVFVSKGTTLAATDFVNKCEDVSGCTYKFTDDVDLENITKTAGGPVKVDIEAVDGKENKVIYTSNLYVTEVPTILYKKCSSQEELLAEVSANKVVQDVLAFGYNPQLSYLGLSVRNYRYTFLNADEYKNIIGPKQSTITFDNHTGIATYLDEVNTLIITENLSAETLASENEGKEFTDLNTVNKIYEDKGYKCNNAAYVAGLDNK